MICTYIYILSYNDGFHFLLHYPNTQYKPNRTLVIKATRELIVSKRVSPYGGFAVLVGIYLNPTSLASEGGLSADAEAIASGKREIHQNASLSQLRLVFVQDPRDRSVRSSSFYPEHNGSSKS